MSYFLVQRTEWRLVEADNQIEAIRSFDKPGGMQVRMHAETEAIAGDGTLRGPIAGKTWDEAWKEAEGILMR